MRSFRFTLLTLALTAPVLAQSVFQLHGFVSARGIYTSGQPSWLQGGFGRLDTGAGDVNGHRMLALGVAQIGAEWAPASWIDLHAHGVARRDQSGVGGGGAEGGAGGAAGVGVVLARDGGGGGGPGGGGGGGGGGVEGLCQSALE